MTADIHPDAPDDESFEAYVRERIQRDPFLVAEDGAFLVGLLDGARAERDAALTTLAQRDTRLAEAVDLLRTRPLLLATPAAMEWNARRVTFLAVFDNPVTGETEEQ